MRKIIFSIIISCLILAILLNINWLHSSIIGLISGLLYVFVFGYLIGNTIFQNKNFSFQLLLGMLTLLSTFSLIGATIYYFTQLNPLIISLLIIIISSLIIVLFYNFRKTPWQIKIKLPIINLKSLMLMITYLILTVVSFMLLFQSRTDQAISSPWELIPSSFFIIYFLATINLILLIIYNKNYLSTGLIYIHFFLTTSIALIIYKLGFGFDPFIHQATELAIFTDGFILPKPFYYLGQYSLVIFLTHLFQISVEWVDKLLLPILLSIFIPYVVYQSTYLTFKWSKKICRILSLVFLILPFSLFIATTPQAIANVMAIIILFLSLLWLKNKQISFYYLIGLTLVCLSVHAITGIPILIYLVIIRLLKSKIKFKNIILIIFSLISAIILPLALFVNSLLSIYKVKLSFDNFNLFNLPKLFSKQYNYFLDISYLYKNSIYLIIFLVSILILIILIKQKKHQIFLGAIITAIILLLNSIFLKFINISFIIDYEQEYFSNRVFILAFYFLLPILFYGLYWLLKTSLNKNFKLTTFLIVIISMLLTSSLYISYPRYDDYDNSKFVNLSQTDLDIVNYIDQSTENDYIVLANQMTSVAAVKTHGFGLEYNNHYFYPLPTGGPLYSYFIKMLNDDTSLETITQAMDLTGVNQAYFVLPTYWDNFKVITENAKNGASQITLINNQAYIYKYIRK